jgi:SAM-dependent methyltransferase
MPWVLQETIKRLKAGKPLQAYRCATWGAHEHLAERRYGIQSTGMHHARDLGSDPTVSHPYSPCSYSILNAIFKRIGPRSIEQGQVFLDVGCGLGRVLAVAAAKPYAAVLGVEISEALAVRARENMARAARRQRCGTVDVFVADASVFEVPDALTTVFFYNPFHGAPMTAFMSNLHASLVRRPRAVDVVFVNPTALLNAEAFPWLRKRDVIECFYPGSERPDSRQSVAFFQASLT